jgi:hypothetical protein
MVVKNSTTYLDIKGSKLAAAWNAGGNREENRFTAHGQWL